VSRLSRRVRTALGRGLAKADTWAAVFALWLAGVLSANDRWGWAVVAGLVGLVFLVSVGDYCWRKGFAARQRNDGG
jgi:hypothetical protein